MREYAVLWHPRAPAKPPLGAPCNGCGLCCLAEPCPMGMLVSRRRTGACSALRWDDQGGHYRCGVLEDAKASGVAPGRWQRWRAKVWLRMARRWIAAGVGCDADLRVD
ncbi:hypothetical protein [Comamonas endophytica]|uniref:4Fe-4S ferredoxin-type domain-containing protein n=1 Tax=Comamonas endophytica TaxID=2949090 RepID=A0ABY6GCR3_9BURK|nr:MULTISPECIES: hypothetical protein [unclassified Acidovorax]MCD2512792.1 hypothetical protein [Acidovorax sp. D4N7]UYG52858.1 hypothetical protein M9799_06355 [Acidovorax sp. 5MLIR]